MAWTDERLEERFDSIDRRFDEVDRRLDEVVGESNRRFDRVEGAIVGLRGEMRGLQTTLNRAGAGIIIGLVGVIAAILTNGS